jgi:hypothetical protein
MDDADAFVSSFLEHAGELPYDPVKAHEYYERTKKLKGRKPGLKTQAQKEGWSYVQSQSREGRKTELDSAATNVKAALEQLRANADKRRKDLEEKISFLNVRIMGTVEKQIAALPNGLPKDVRAAKVADIRAKANKERESGKLATQNEAKQIVSDLRSGIEAARTNYKKLREGIKTKYDAKSSSDYDAISANVR